MKIKDVVVEGVLDYAKGLLKTGTVAGAKAVNQQAQATKQIKPFIDSIINSWNRYVGLTGKSTAADAVGWAANTFKSDLSPVNQPANNSPQEINRFLTDVSKSYKAGVLTSTAGTGKKYKPRQSAVTPIQPTQPIQAPTQVNQNPLNITIRQSTDPIIVDYQGKPYMLNRRGQWAKDGDDGKNKQASETVQAEIDKVLRANNLP
jgi:hypothetical protein